jgi:hypothetical protein
MTTISRTDSGSTVEARTSRTTTEVILGLVLAAGVAVLANIAVSALAHAAGASPTFRHLSLTIYGPATVAGILIGTTGWAVIRRRAGRPARTLTIAVPVAVVLSWAPDLLLAAQGTEPGLSLQAIAGLMSMHLVVAAVAVLALRRILPLPVNG